MSTTLTTERLMSSSVPPSFLPRVYEIFALRLLENEDTCHRRSYELLIWQFQFRSFLRTSTRVPSYRIPVTGCQLPVTSYGYSGVRLYGIRTSLSDVPGDTHPAV